MPSYLYGDSHHKYDPDSKVHGANIGPIWGRQGQGGPHVGPISFLSGEPLLHVLCLW